MALPSNGVPAMSGAQTNGAPPMTNGSSQGFAPLGGGNQDFEQQRVDEILHHEVGVNALLIKLKQSAVSCRDFAGFLRKRAMLEDEHAQGLKKLCKLTYDSFARGDGRQGTFLAGLKETTQIHERLAENGASFAEALIEMQEELLELVNNTERGRKQWKQTSTTAEKRGPEAQALLQKAKARYDSLAEEVDKARNTTGGGRGSRIFGGQRSHHEEELRRKLEAADMDYNRQVMFANNTIKDLYGNSRPQTVKALIDLIKECDSGLSLQLQKFGSLNEQLALNNAICIRPTTEPKGADAGPGLRDVLEQVNNDKDFNSHLMNFSNKVPPNTRPAEIHYERHPAHTAALQAALQMQQLAEQTPPPRQPQGPPEASPYILPAVVDPSPGPSPHGQTMPPVSPYIASPVSGPQQQPRQVSHGQPMPRSLVPPPNNGIPPNPALMAPPQPQPNQQVPQQQQQYLPRLKPVFGVPLDDLLARDGNAVPMIVIQCMQAVDLYGLNMEGIYRLGGAQNHIQHIKQIFDNDSSQVDFRNPEDFSHDINSVTSALKLFFRELPDPLLTHELYPELIEAAKIDDDSLRRDTLHGLINRLPDANYATIRALVLHLHRVMQNYNVTRMNSWGLAICFGPCLMGSSTNENMANTNWQNRVVDTILQNALEIFDDDN